MRAGRDRLRAASIVAELDQRRRFVERFNDRADLAADEAVPRQIAQQRDRAEESTAFVALWRRSGHHKTQQVTKLSLRSPFLTIQIVLPWRAAIATSSCRQTSSPSSLWRP